MPAKSAADLDVATGVLALWAAAKLDNAVPGGLHQEPLPRPRPAGPYAALSVRQGPRANEYSTGGQYIDYRRVTIKLYAVGKANIGGAHAAIKTALEDQANPPPVPNVVSVMRVEPLPDNVGLAKMPVRGDDIVEDILEWCIWTHRSQ